MQIKKSASILLGLILVLTIASAAISASYAVKPAPPPVTLLNPKTIPKYVNSLNVDPLSAALAQPPVYVPDYTDPVTGTEYYTVGVTEFSQQILPQFTAAGVPTGFGQTTVWGYGGQTTSGYVANAPGPSFEATKGTPFYVRYQNLLTGDSLFAVDPTLHWANPNNIPMATVMNEALTGLAPPYYVATAAGTSTIGYNGAPYLNPITGVLQNPNGYNAQSPVPIIPHLHGGEVQSTSDGNPEAWFTADGKTGPEYNTELTTWYDGTPIGNNEVAFYYPNAQPATTLWYHDHALGITRTNVLSGLAGFYLLREPSDPVAAMLPATDFEMPLVIQDRTFDINGQFYFPDVGINPEHPYWLPEFFGDTIMVNGLVWPNMNVQQGIYRLRLLDGSNARFYTLSFSNKMPFTIIGSDGGYLPFPSTVTQLTIAPGERYDILVDFTAVPLGTKLILKNTAKAPFPAGTTADPQTVGQIMQFTVVAPQTGVPTPPTTSQITPTTQLNTIPTITPVTKTRQMTLIEVMGAGGPLEILLNGQKWAAPISEDPKLGTTEEWVIVNPTADAHPIHLHLVQFQVVSRQPFQTNKYLTDWIKLNGPAPLPNTATVNNPPYQLYLQNKPTVPLASEQGWKDTVQAYPGEVTIIRARWAPIDGTTTPGTLYPFDATLGPGYVWHCHILDHEDNEMMRPYVVTP
jgi:spore coat protein A